MDRWLKRLADLSTTNFRITVSVVLASLWVLAALGAVLVFDWQPSAAQIAVMDRVGVLLLTMMGLDVLQFASKRYSDASLAAAKNSAIVGPVASDSPPATVEMTPKTPTVAVTPAPPSIAGGA